jgi:hypothetical protein
LPVLLLCSSWQAPIRTPVSFPRHPQALPACQVRHMRLRNR